MGGNNPRAPLRVRPPVPQMCGGTSRIKGGRRTSREGLEAQVTWSMVRIVRIPFLGAKD